MYRAMGPRKDGDEATPKRTPLTYEERVVVFEMAFGGSVLDHELVRTAAAKLGRHPDSIYRLKTALDIMQRPEFAMPNTDKEFDQRYGSDPSVGRHKVTRRFLRSTARDLERWRRERTVRPGPVPVVPGEPEPTALLHHRDSLLAAAKRLGDRLWVPDWEHPVRALIGSIAAVSTWEKEYLESHWRYVYDEPLRWDDEPVYDSLRAHTAGHPCWTAYARFLDVYRRYWDHLNALATRLVPECRTLEDRFLRGPAENQRFVAYGTGHWDVVQILSFVLFQMCGKVPGVVWSGPGYWYWVQGYRESGESLTWGGSAIAWGNPAWLADARAAHEGLVKRLMNSADITRFLDLFDQLAAAKDEARRAFVGITRTDLSREHLPCCPAPGEER